MAISISPLSLSLISSHLTLAFAHLQSNGRGRTDGRTDGRTPHPVPVSGRFHVLHTKHALESARQSVGLIVAQTRVRWQCNDTQQRSAHLIWGSIQLNFIRIFNRVLQGVPQNFELSKLC